MTDTRADLDPGTGAILYPPTENELRAFIFATINAIGDMISKTEAIDAINRVWRSGVVRPHARPRPVEYSADEICQHCGVVRPCHAHDVLSGAHRPIVLEPVPPTLTEEACCCGRHGWPGSHCVDCPIHGTPPPATTKTLQVLLMRAYQHNWIAYEARDAAKRELAAAQQQIATLTTERDEARQAIRRLNGYRSSTDKV